VNWGNWVGGVEVGVGHFRGWCGGGWGLRRCGRRRPRDC